MINPESMANLVLFCDWCGEELDENGNCPVCEWHSPIFDKLVAPARKELAERAAAEEAAEAEAKEEAKAEEKAE